jgi:hypothetical protein
MQAGALDSNRVQLSTATESKPLACCLLAHDPLADPPENKTICIHSTRFTIYIALDNKLVLCAKYEAAEGCCGEKVSYEWTWNKCINGTEERILSVVRSIFMLVNLHNVSSGLSQQI